jgi:hypothetical protein
MKKWRKKQIKDAKDFNGKETPRSGGIWSFAGDVKTSQFLIESKTTDKKSYSLKESTWKKIEHEALKSSRIPMMSISLTDYGIDVVILDKNDFIELLKNKTVD